MTIAQSLACIRTALEMLSLATDDAVTRRLLPRIMELVDEALGGERADARERKRKSRCHSDTASLSLFSEDLKSEERERPAAAPAPITQSPPGDEPPVRADDLLTVERQLVAERAGVADPGTCWRKFCLAKAGKRLAVGREAAWELWCLNERNRAPPKSAAAPPASETRLKVSERQRARDREAEELRRAAVPAPPALRELLAGLAKGRAPPATPASLSTGT